MSDIKFSCPQCQQHIQAEQGYAGMEISCPACNARMVVPGRPVAIPPPPPAVAGTACPSCGARLAPGAMLCTSCGYNVRTGQRLPPRPVASKPAARPAAAPHGADWFRTPYPYLAMFVAGMSVLFFFARSNEAALLPYLGVSVLYVFTVHIVVLVCAFRASIGQGFLCLCIPIYAVYFVFKQSESSMLMAFYAVAILLELSLYAFKGLE
jgi:DNA-directed RNA polymerase subunit RPC12/RpoP